jgi:ribose transport system ATP-binding protein
MSAELSPLAQEVRLEVSGIRKQFPGVVALDDVSLRLRAGEIHALLGENGAGKSTLIKILTGVYQPDEGEIRLDGSPIRFSSPHAALAAGISVVHQERNLIPQFTVAENILLERMPTRGVQLVDHAAVNRLAKPWIEMVGLDVNPAMAVVELSVAQMQLVEIAKALSLQARILLMDEPTAAITPHEVGYLFRILGDLRRRHVALVFVSHKLEEVFELCDRVTVLRDGKNASADVAVADLDRDQLVTYMIGRAEVISKLPTKPKPGDVVLEASGLITVEGDPEISLELRKGEVLGLYGLVGAGRSRLARTLVGEIKPAAGDVRVNGAKTRIKGFREALEKYRIGYVSEDRKQEGLILLHSVRANTSITIWRRLVTFGQWIRRSAEDAAILPSLRRLDVRSHSLSQPVGTLSGGNQQKVSIAKWLAAKAEILIIDEPTVGIDVKTKNALHELIWDLAASGKSVLLISSDMPEVIRLSDRILVMRNHAIVGELPNTGQYDEMSEAIMARLS